MDSSRSECFPTPTWCLPFGNGKNYSIQTAFKPFKERVTSLAWGVMAMGNWNTCLGIFWDTNDCPYNGGHLEGLVRRPLFEFLCRYDALRKCERHVNVIAHKQWSPRNPSLPYDYKAYNFTPSPTHGGSALRNQRQLAPSRVRLQV